MSPEVVLALSLTFGAPAPSLDVAAALAATFGPTTTLPTDPNTPAPVGYQWIKYGDAPWKLERIAASAVATPRPFPPEAFTPGTTAQRAVGVSTPFPASTGTAPITTRVPWTGQLGGTSYCPPSG